ncbi:MAG: hypothetical protein HYZ53_27725 [Planctomycetes bacterium]|nr:hypothetical protein [Planctomycetota bacterium]
MANELMLGRMAVARGLLTNAQLEEAIAEREKRDPKPQLGILLLSKGYLRQETLDGLMQVQNKMFRVRDPRTRERLEDRLLAQIILKERMTPPDAVNRALELQAKTEAAGRWRRIGDILVSQGDLTWEQLGRALEIQMATVRICPICAAPLPAGPDPDTPVACPRCASQVNSHSSIVVSRGEALGGGRGGSAAGAGSGTFNVSDEAASAEVSKMQEALERSRSDVETVAGAPASEAASPRQEPPRTGEGTEAPGPGP